MKGFFAPVYLGGSAGALLAAVLSGVAFYLLIAVLCLAAGLTSWLLERRQ